MIIASALTHNSTISIEKQNCSNVNTSISVRKISEKKSQLVNVVKDGEENCTGDGFQLIKGWSSVKQPIVDGAVYRTDKYEIIHIYVNIYTRQVNKSK